MAGSTKNCTNFLDLVVDDNFALEGDEAFIIIVNSSMAMVTIVDDDGRFVIKFYSCYIL